MPATVLLGKAGFARIAANPVIAGVPTTGSCTWRAVERVGHVALGCRAVIAGGSGDLGGRVKNQSSDGCRSDRNGDRKSSGQEQSWWCLQSYHLHTPSICWTTSSEVPSLAKVPPVPHHLDRQDAFERVTPSVYASVDYRPSRLENRHAPRFFAVYRESVASHSVFTVSRLSASPRGGRRYDSPNAVGVPGEAFAGYVRCAAAPFRGMRGSTMPPTCAYVANGRSRCCRRP